MYNYDVEKNVKSILCGNVAFFFFFFANNQLEMVPNIKEKNYQMQKKSSLSSTRPEAWPQDI